VLRLVLSGGGLVGCAAKQLWDFLIVGSQLVFLLSARFGDNDLFFTADLAPMCCNNNSELLVLRLVLFGGGLVGCAAKPLWELLEVCRQLAFLLSPRVGDDGLFFTAAAVAR
jgi:hypothetical protein